MPSVLIQKTYDISGTVQGVGFRPTVHRLATAAGLKGWIQNRSGTVRLLLQGTPEQIEAFISKLPDNLPPSAEITDCRLAAENAASTDNQCTEFLILESSKDSALRVSFPPDLAVCGECLKEVSNPNDRRYGYAFTTCTNCGPRYTVINGMPYDRERTTLAAFPLCETCRAEYTDPAGRRFHAESTACPQCGPQLFCADVAGRTVTDVAGRTVTDAAGRTLTEAAVSYSRRRLAAGGILALRGIGGYALAVDAFNREAITTLRARKLRPHKPFAVMARSLEVLDKYCVVPECAKKLLLSPEAPIVILDLRAGENSLPADLLSPDTLTIGAMLPTAPLHWLLFHPLTGDPTPAFEMLIMTSGNKRSEPICISNQEAFERLNGIADLFLCHDREINLRADDSLCTLQADRVQVWRRGRGLTPQSIALPAALKRCSLAMGAELKNAIAVGHAREITPSAHIGDLETLEAVKYLEQVVDCYPRFLYLQPEVVAVDLHPDMHSSILGRSFARKAGLPVVEIQHHYAHAAACMAEHGKTECLALVFDGTGLGTDGTVWGAELLHCTLSGFTRLGTFAGVPLPGGDAAVREPARQLVARWTAAGIDPSEELLLKLNIGGNKAKAWAVQATKGINSPISHAAGRLFDAFAVLLGFSPAATTYDGQSAIRLEAAARQSQSVKPALELSFSLSELNGILVVDWQKAFEALSDCRVLQGREAAWAMAVHTAVSRAALVMVEFGLARVSTRTVALSGGVFMNKILAAQVAEALCALNLEVITHAQVPPNDGGIAVGQAYITGSNELCV